MAEIPTKIEGTRSRLIFTTWQ